MSTGFPFGKMEHQDITGTTSVITDGPAAIKNVLPREYTGATRIKLDVRGEGAPVYLENGISPRDGLNFPTAVVEIDGDNPEQVAVVRLTDTKVVVLSNVANAKLEATVVDISGTVPVPGTIATINNADTDSVGAVAIGTAGTHFAVIYRDDGGDDYVYGRIGSVSGTTITMGDEKALDSTNAGVLVANVRYGVCEPRPGVLFFTFHDSDTHLTAVAAPYSGLVIGTLGSQNKPDGTNAPTEIACCAAGDNKVFVAFGNGGDSNNLHGRVATVSAAGAIGTWGTEKDLISTGDAAATYVSCENVQTDKVIIYGEDASNDPFAIAATISTTTITVGTFKVFLGGSTTDIGGTMRDPVRGFIKWDNGTNGQVISFSISGVTITADASIENFVETAAAGGLAGGIVYIGNDKVFIAYEDADNDVGCKAGTYFENRIIDVRSATASIGYTGEIIPNFNNKAVLAKI